MIVSTIDVQTNAAATSINMIHFKSLKKLRFLSLSEVANVNAFSGNISLKLLVLNYKTFFFYLNKKYFCLSGKGQDFAFK